MEYLTDGSQVFNVPNNEEGWAFIKQCHKFLHKRRQKLVKRGRGKRDGTWAGRVSISPKKGEWIAVYTQYKKSENQQKLEAILANEKKQCEDNLIHRIMELEKELKTIKSGVAKSLQELLA